MYIMSNEAKELTQIRQITVKKYSKNKWISISDLQKNLDLQNLFNLAKKKLNVTAIQNILLKVKLEDIKEK